MKRQAGLLAAVHVIAGALFLSPSYIRPDSVGVVSWLRSLIVDGDFLFFDEWAGFRMLGNGFAYFKEVTPVGGLANHWWVGTSILTAPFYVISHALSMLLPGKAFPVDGFFGLDLVTLGWTSVLFHALTLALASLIVRRITTEPISKRALAATLVFTSVGTPAFWYAFRMPLGTHAAGMFLVGALTYLCVRRLRKKPPVELEPATHSASTGSAWLDSAFLLGLVLGLATATRLQHAVILPAVLFVLVRSRSSARDWFSAAAGTLLPLLVQGAAWFAVYGNPLGPLVSGASLDGVTWMLFRRISFLPVLFSSWRGLFVWSPIWAPALIGLYWLVRDKESPLRRDVGVICLLVFTAELFANATLDRYWWGGMSFGPRRFVDLAVPAALGLWAFLERTRLIGMVISAFAATWSVVLMIAAAAGTLDLARYLDWKAIARGVGSMGASISFDLLRSPVTSSMLALQSCVALAITCGIVAAIGVLARRRPSGGSGLLTAWVLACLVASIAAIGSTRSRADSMMTRFGMNTEAARSAGPLIDQRGLISDELVWLEATGRDRQANLTKDEIARIDEELARLGVAP